MAPADSQPGGPPARFTAETAAEVCAGLELEDEAAALLSDDAAPLAFLEALVGAELFVDAIRFLAAALPKRRAVWWACLAVRATGAELEPPDGEALAAAERWVTGPSEDVRVAAMTAAETAGYATPAALAAAAAAWSGGSMTPPELETVPPPENLTAHTVAAAVMLAAAAAKPEEVAATQHRLIARGVAVAEGKETWGPPGTSS